MTDRADGKLSFAYQSKADIYAGADNRIFLAADAYTGQILSENNPAKMPRGSAIKADWQLPVHFGEFRDLATQLIWFIAGLIPALLTVTGFKIWRGKKKKKGNKRREPTFST